MRFVTALFGLFVLLSAAFASANYTSQFTLDGWLSVTRTAEVRDSAACAGAATGACGDTGAAAPGDLSNLNGISTTITLTAENIGPVDRSYVQLSESLLHVPNGARISFTPNQSYSDGRKVVWALSELKRGESKSVSYTYFAKADAGDIEKIPSASVQSGQVILMLSATPSLKAGEEIAISLKTPSGQAVDGTVVRIGYPDGSSQYVKTDSAGRAKFVANHEGFYTYSVEGFSLAKMVSTQVQPMEEIPQIAASAIAGGNLAASLSGLLPVLGAIFAVAVIALMIYNFLTSKKEEYAPLQPAASQQLAYKQSYSFGSPAAKAGATRDITRDLVESRKRQMPPAEKPVQPEEKPPTQWPEATAAEGDIDGELSKLEAQARSEGELASQEEGELAGQEEEIENAIAELESIRQKLRERKEQMEEIGAKLEGGGEGQEPVQPKKPSYGKGPQRVLPPKGKKLRMATHGVKRK